MAITNTERVGRGLEQLKLGLGPFVERELKATYKDKWRDTALPSFPDWQTRAYQLKKGELVWDAQALISVMLDLWRDCFAKILGASERTILNELRDVRNKHAHQKTFSTDDAYRALDSMARLLMAVSAMEATAVEQMKSELLRLKFEEQIRGEKRKETASPVEGRPAGGLRPWRELITPHPDVASGRYQQAEFAADLWQVYLGEGTEEYKDPVEFYRRTFITEGLHTLLKNAIRRLAGQGGDPVVELQTNFGGGKTHSMLALFHLCASVPTGLLPGMEVVAADLGISLPSNIKRAVLVGNRISPGTQHKKKDGTVVRTLWGELAWQLGKKEGYEIVRAADEKGVSPGDELRILFQKFSPCLILIDEWVAYARQLYNKSDLPAGDFDAHFTFAQTLSESVKLVDDALLVVSIPASQNEIGGDGGQAALIRLKNVMQRVETSWRPATAEESFEIVRRRLFQQLTDPEALKARDVVIRSFIEEYRRNSKEFPEEASQVDYERRMQRAYPVHPELFDRLYNDWASLEGFQRTRGVLRLMSAVIHRLWEREDKNLLIMPGIVPVDADTVQEELVRYLPPEWKYVIEKDIDGETSLPLRLDRENPLFGRFSACRRVARTLYLGSAPTMEVAKKGVEDRRIKLGCVQPGETSATFGDALRKLLDQSTYLYLDGSRYWYSTQASISRLAQERAGALPIHDVYEETRLNLQEQAKERGEFQRAQACPPNFSEVPDEPEARLVILGPEYPHASKQTNSAAREYAAQILDRGGAGRNCPNMLVFLAADQAKWGELEQAVRLQLAWKSIVKDIGQRVLNVDMAQADQAQKKLETATDTVRGRIPECYQWLLVPGQSRPLQGEKFPSLEWQEIRLPQGQEQLAVRASKRLTKDELLMVSMAGARLLHEINAIPLWSGELGESVGVKLLAEQFAKYFYLPRIKNSQVLVEAIQDGVNRITWRQDTFAYADSYDPVAQRYRGLVVARRPSVQVNATSLVVKADAAAAQLEKDAAAAPTTSSKPSAVPEPAYGGTGSPKASPGSSALPPKILRRFYGSVRLDPARMAKESGEIAQAIVQHLASLVDADVTVTLEVQANMPGGAPDSVVRTISENSRTLKFDSSNFEEL